MLESDQPANVVQVGGATVVIATDAAGAAATADGLAEAGSRTAIFVGAPGPAAAEFCQEIFGAHAGR